MFTKVLHCLLSLVHITCLSKPYTLQDVFKAYRILFDEVIERLPASGILLAKIKVSWTGIHTDSNRITFTVDLQHFEYISISQLSTIKLMNVLL